ncbi:MAG TPA: TonB family protein [Blastocatellia bacterium]|nr:TonB family protein [Blastocatellia bacterium]
MTFHRVRGLFKMSIIACSLLAAPVTAAIIQQQETAEQFIERTKKAIERDEWDRARSGVRHAVALNPESPEAQFLAAQVYAHEGARSMAIESLEKAIANKPDFPEAHLLLASCLRDAGKTSRAREEVNTAIAQGTPLFPAYVLVGEIDSAENKFEAAAASFEAALRVSESGTQEEAAKLRVQRDNLLDVIEVLKRVAGLEVAQSGPGTIGPVLVNNPVPRYPEEARKLKIQGAVSMFVFITENGEVKSVLLFRKLVPGLDEQALEAARQLKFTPASRNGQPIPCWKKVQIEFHLR